MDKERPMKHILVALYYKGRTHWALVAARKVGKHYQISQEAYDKLITLPPGSVTTISLG